MCVAAQSLAALVLSVISLLVSADVFLSQKIDICPSVLFLLLRASALIHKALAHPVTVESDPGPGRELERQTFNPGSQKR